MDKTFIFLEAEMNDDFNVEEFRPAIYQPDTELTMGPMLLLGLFFSLVLVCGLSFGAGYSMGRRSAHVSTTTGQQPGAGTAVQAASSLPKPLAAQQNIHQKPRPALAAAPVSASAQPAVGLPTPATAPALALMVQIAAVSHQEDANVLVGALRKRGYAVSVSRDAADNQLHVRIGPFSNRNDANAMRKKLIYDGYNAVVQP
jgi:cell division septation protein DedD